MAEEQLQIHLITKQTQFAVPDTPYSIQSNVTTKELNSLLNTLLQETQDEMYTEVEFDFLVRGEFLKHTLAKHLKEREVSFEDVVDIEYVERFPAPEPLDVLLHDDWVSAIQANGDWILTGSYDNSVNIWNMKGDHKLSLPTGHEAPIKGVGWISLNEDSGTATFATGSKGFFCNFTLISGFNSKSVLKIKRFSSGSGTYRKIQPVRFSTVKDTKELSSVFRYRPMASS